jgi:V/A-type H+/Na+-transporting ATPase subunit E
LGEEAMTGLDKILKAIEAEAQAGADTVIAQATREAETILLNAKSEAEAKCKVIAEKSEADVKAVISRAESAAALQEKKILLDAKQQIISNIITSARKSLDGLSSPEYTKVILSMVKKYAHNKPGKILFSSADRARLSNDFTEQIKTVLAGKTGAALELGKEEPSFEGGFLLVYGDIEENCSFDALFAAERDMLQDKVNSLLFE